MRFLKIAASTALLAALSGCGTFYQPSAVATLQCSGKQCDRIWSKAQSWLATNSRYRLQTVTDSVIQTYGPHEGVYGAVAFTLTREPGKTDDTQLIKVFGSCRGTVYGCVFDPSVQTNELFFELEKIK